MGRSVCSLVSKVATPFHLLTMSDTHIALAVIFDVPEGQEFKSFFPKFYAKVKTGTKDCIYYGFATCGNKVLCREGYKGAAGLMAHMGEVKEDLEKMIKQIGKERVKILMSGPASELDKVKPHMDGRLTVKCGAGFWSTSTQCFPQGLPGHPHHHPPGVR